MRITLSFFYFLFFIPSFSFSQNINVVPYPESITIGEGEFIVDENLTISVSENDLMYAAIVFIDDIYKVIGKRIRVESGGQGKIVLSIDDSLEADEYQLSVKERISVSGGSYSSLCQGAMTLIQLFDDKEDEIIIPHCEIKDSPANSFRSLMVDVARQVVDITTLYQVVDLCRFYKIPFFQLHIADDQAFCFPSKHYPELATKGHSYSLEELYGLVNYANSRGVTIIPELDGPGHSTAIREVKPEIFGSADFRALDVTSDTMYAAMGILVREMFEVFYSTPYFHIGADEAWLNDEFLATPHVVNFMEKNDFDAEELKRYYVVKMDSIVKSNGMKTMAWESFKANNDSSKVKIPTDILVNAWETLYERPEQLVDHGFDIINTSWKPYYTVRSHRWPPAYIYNFSKYRYANHWEKAPSYIPFDMPPSEKIKGGQMCAWEQFDVQIIDGLRSRLPAFSEYYWLGDSRPGYEDFEKRYDFANKKLERLFSTLDFSIKGNTELMEVDNWNGEVLPHPEGWQTNSHHWFAENISIELKSIFDSAEIYFTTDGSAPSVESSVYSNKLTFNTDTHLKVLVMIGEVEAGRQQFLFEHRPIIAELKGLKINEKETEPYWYNPSYSDRLVFEFKTNADQVEIRYTLDGSEPSINSNPYSVPFSISSDEEITVRAKAFKNGQAFGQEWRPADYYDKVKFYQPKRYYKFKRE